MSLCQSRVELCLTGILRSVLEFNVFSENGPCDSQSVCNSARILLPVARTMNRIVSDSSCARLDVYADLVFYYSISEVVRKIAHGGHISFLLRLFGGTSPFG